MDRGRHQRLAQQHAGVVDQVARRECDRCRRARCRNRAAGPARRGAQLEIVRATSICGLSAQQALARRLDLRRRRWRCRTAPGAAGSTHRRDRDRRCPACRRRPPRDTGCRRAEAAGADDQHARSLQLLLPAGSDLLEAQVSADSARVRRRRASSASSRQPPLSAQIRCNVSPRSIRWSSAFDRVAVDEQADVRADAILLVDHAKAHTGVARSRSRAPRGRFRPAASTSPGRPCTSVAALATRSRDGGIARWRSPDFPLLSRPRHREHLRAGVARCTSRTRLRCGSPRSPLSRAEVQPEILRLVVRAHRLAQAR